MRHISVLVILLLCASFVFRQNTRTEIIPAGMLLQCTVNEPNLSSKTVAVGDSEYWVQGVQMHCIGDTGEEKLFALERIDLGQTVPLHIFQQVANSSSLGRAFHSVLREKYPSSRL